MPGFLEYLHRHQAPLSIYGICVTILTVDDEARNCLGINVFSRQRAGAAVISRKRRMIFHNGGEPAHPATGPKGQNLVETVPTMGGGPRSRGILQGTPARTQQRKVASEKTANFHEVKRNTTVRTCGLIIHAAHFHILILLQALSGASRRQNLGSAPLFFSASGQRNSDNWRGRKLG